MAENYRKGYSGFFGIQSAVSFLIIINVIMFFLQILLGASFTESLMLTKDIFRRPWILVTSMFLHGGIAHLFFNMYALFLFGSLIEQRIGTKKFLIAYFLSGIFASFVSSFFYDAALGASGAIMGILGMVIVMMPDLPVLLFFVIPMTMRTAGIIFALMDIFGLFHNTGIGNIAHLTGLAIGLIYGYYLKKKGIGKVPYYYFY